MCVCVWVGGWTCAYVCWLNKPNLSQELDQVRYWRRQCAATKRAREEEFFREEPSECEWVKNWEQRTDADEADMKRGNMKEKREEVAKWGRDLETEGTWKIERAKDKEINEREGRQLPVGVSASPRSDWELQATLSSLSLHTRRCHISLTGQQAPRLLRPSPTSMWIITQRGWRQRKNQRLHIHEGKSSIMELSNRNEKRKKTFNFLLVQWPTRANALYLKG